jgi:hypothetical protein
VQALAATIDDRSNKATSALYRSAVLLLVLAIHAALLLVAIRWVIRVDMRREEPLVFLSLPEHVQPAEPAAAAALPRKKPSPRDTQIISIPQPVQPNAAEKPPPVEKPPPTVNWNAEADLAAKRQAELAMAPKPRALDKRGAGADVNGGLTEPKDGSDFGWDHSHTHRVETVEGGGVVIHLNDRCVIVLMPFPFPFCGIGKIPVRGDLFEHMHDEPQTAPNRKNIAP